MKKNCRDSVYGVTVCIDSLCEGTEHGIGRRAEQFTSF